MNIAPGRLNRKLISMLSLVSLCTLLAGCPMPLGSMKSHLPNSALENQLALRYPPKSEYRRVFFVGRHSYVDLYLVSGTLQDGPAPTTSTFIQAGGKEQAIGQLGGRSGMICLYVPKNKAFQIILRNTHSHPKVIETPLKAVANDSFYFIRRTGLYAAPKVRVIETDKKTALPYMLHKYAAPDSCSVISDTGQIIKKESVRGESAS